MKIRELRVLAREKLSEGLSKQAAFDLIVSMNVIRIHDVACAVRDIASNFYKKKFKKLNLVLIVLIILAGISQASFSLLFPEKITVQTLPSDIFLMITYIAISIGIYSYYKLSFSAAIFLSIISIYMSIQNIISTGEYSQLSIYYSIIGLLGLLVIGLSAHLYSKYFRGFDIKPAVKTDEDQQPEFYVFKEEL